MIVYKVVCKVDRYLSKTARVKAEVEYTIGVRAKAPSVFAKQGYYLLAFTTLERAREFNSLGGCILKCEAGTEVDLPPMCCFFDIDNGHLHPVSRAWPTGTIMVKTLIPLEEV